MSRCEVYTLTLSASFNSRHFRDAWVQVHGVSGSMLSIEGSIDGATFVPSNGLGAVTSDGCFEVKENFVAVRVRLTSGTGAGLTLTFAGRQERAS